MPPVAVLREDRTILFSSVEEFLDQMESHVGQGGLFLDTPVDWPQRTTIPFTVRIQGLNTGIVIRAEPVYSGGGKVGLQIAPEAGGLDELRLLAEQLDDPPVLGSDGVVRYRSAAAFQADHATRLSSGFLYVHSGQPCTPDEPLELALRIEEHDLDLTIRAVPVFSDGSSIRFRLDRDAGTMDALADMAAYLANLEESGEEEETTGESEVTPAVPPSPAEQRVEPETPAPAPVPQDVPPGGIEGEVGSSGDVDEFQSRPFSFADNPSPVTNLFRLLASTAAAGQAADLTIDTGEERHTFTFNREGLLVRHQGPGADADLVDRLATRYTGEEHVLEKLKEECNADQPADELVLDRGFSKEQVRVVLREQVVDCLEAIRRSRKARFRLVPSGTTRTEGIRFGFLITPWMEAALKALPPAEVKKLLKPLWDAPLCRHQEPAWNFNFIDLDDDEYAFVQSLDGSVPLQTRIKQAPRHLRNKLMRRAITLHAIGTLTAPGLEPEPPPGEKEERPEELLDQEVQALERSGNPFLQAGVHWSTHPREYESALLALGRQFGPGSELAATSEQAARLCARRLELAKRAVAELKEVDLRLHYRQQFVPSSNLLVSAKMMFEKAMETIQADKLEEAIPYLEMAVEFDPVPDYKKKLQWVRKRIAWKNKPKAREP